MADYPDDENFDPQADSRNAQDELERAQKFAKRVMEAIRDAATLYDIRVDEGYFASALEGICEPLYDLQEIRSAYTSTGDDATVYPHASLALCKLLAAEVEADYLAKLRESRLAVMNPATPGFQGGQP